MQVDRRANVIGDNAQPLSDSQGDGPTVYPSDDPMFLA